MTIIISLGKTPETSWQAKGAIARAVLMRADALATDEDVRLALRDAKLYQLLDLNEMESPLKERVWQAVEQAARDVVAGGGDGEPGWLPRWTEHVAELAREMEARRTDQSRPGVRP